MRITFIGVGEAFDETVPNTSVLVESDTTSLLLDCGFTAAHAFWRTARAPLDLDGIYFTHFHGDHYFGIPALLLRFVDEGRTKPLTILGQPGVERQIRQLVDMAYPNVLSKAKFDISFRICMGCQEATVGNMTLSFAMGDHPLPSQAVRVDSQGKSMFFSGDGRPTDDTLTVATGCDLVIHESFSLEPETPGHGTVDSSLRFALEAGAEHLALVHLQRGIRQNHFEEIQSRMSQEGRLHIFIPNPGDSLEL